MRIHQRTETEQQRIVKRAVSILKADPGVQVYDLAERFGMSGAGFAQLLRKSGYQREQGK